MIKIEIKEGLKIEVDLSIKETTELVNALVKNRNDLEVKLLITHLSTIIESYRTALIEKNKKPTRSRSLAELLKN